MSSSNSDDFLRNLRSLYGKAALQREAARKLNGEEWQQYREIREQFATQRRAEQRSYDQSYAARVNTVTKRLINKAGQTGTERKLTHRLFGADPFDKKAIRSKAKKIVQAEHSLVLQSLDRQRDQALDGLLARASYRQTLKEKPKRAFSKAANRRSGKDRRTRSPTR